MLTIGQTFDVGDQPLMTSTFTLDGVPTTATPAAFVRRPDGTVETLEPDTTADPGVYETLLPVLDQPGRWYVRIESESGVVAAEEGRFAVRRSMFS